MLEKRRSIFMLAVFAQFIAAALISFPADAKTKQKSKKRLTKPEQFAGQVCKREETDKMMCMVCNIYFEARGEAHAGKVAVGRTTLTRITRSEFPDSICGVVWQRGQFSWTTDRHGKKLPKAGSAGYATLVDTVQAAKDVFKQGPNGLAYFCNPKKSSCPWRYSPLCQASRKRIGAHLFCNTT